MLRKPGLEAVLVLVTSLAAVGLTVAALLMPVREPAATAVTPVPQIVGPVTPIPPVAEPTAPIPPVVAPTAPAAGARAARPCSLAGGERAKPARQTAPAGGAPRPRCRRLAVAAVSS